MSKASLPAILCLSTAGASTMDPRRMRRLCEGLRAEVVFHSVNREAGRRASTRIVRALLESRRWDLVYLEGTGITGGLPLCRAAREGEQRFIVSSGDPVGGFFRVTRGPLWGRIFEIYEKRLYRACTAFVGWTPYLTGAALRLGARRAITIEGGVDLCLYQPSPPEIRAATRSRLGLAAGHVVLGMVGSLIWNKRQSYCYGLELVETLKRMRRSDVSVLVVGDGDGLARLKARVTSAVQSRIIFTGRLPAGDVASVMCAMDIGFVTQSMDELGSFRLTTKLPEYLACGVPVAMSPVPGFYDYVQEAGWPLPPFHPASAEFHLGCAKWLDGLAEEEISAKAFRARGVAEKRFDYDRLGEKFRSFVDSLLGEDAPGEETAEHCREDYEA